MDWFDSFAKRKKKKEKIKHMHGSYILLVGNQLFPDPEKGILKKFHEPLKESQCVTESTVKFLLNFI